MSIFLSIAGPILASSNLSAQIQGKGKAKSDEKEMPTGGRGSSTTKQQKPMAGFSEEAEED